MLRSTGTGPDGSSATIDSVYPWAVTYSNVPGGVVTYFSGSVSQSVSHYTGDLVLRNGNWTCPQGGMLTGDLYVLERHRHPQHGCVINGDIYANGNVASTSQNWHVRARGTTSAGNITTNGTVSFDSNGNSQRRRVHLCQGSDQAQPERRRDRHGRRNHHIDAGRDRRRRRCGRGCSFPGLDHRSGHTGRRYAARVRSRRSTG